MEYVDFLNHGAKLVHEQVIKAGYEISENSPYCLMMSKILALHDGSAKKIYICTHNLKNILLWNAPQGPKEVLSKSREKEARFFMSKALTHEAVHAAQYCNSGMLIAPQKASPEVAERKSKAIELSLAVGGARSREEEAYLLESDPFFVAKSIEKFCFD